MAEDSTQSIPFQYTGAHKYKGTIYYRPFPANILTRIEQEAVWSKDTVIVATYPKSGMT